MKRPPSIRHRLLITLLGVVVLAWLATSLLVYIDARHETGELFDAQLAQSARVLLAISEHELQEQQAYRAIDGKPRAAETVRIPDPALRGPHHEYEHKLAFQVWSAEGLALRSPNAPAQPLTNGDIGFSDSPLNGQPWRVFSLRSPDSGILVQVAQSLAIRGELIGAISQRLLTPLLLSLPLLALLIWFGIGRALQPLLRLADDVRQRDPDYLAPLPLAEAPEESRALVEALNHLFARLQQAFENERRFTADAAHELRTPLAALKVQAQVALGAADDEARRSALRHILQGVDRATHLVSQLLTLARLDPDCPAAEDIPLRLDALAREALAEQADTARQRDIELALEADEAAVVVGSPDSLRILLRNLLDNAIRYTPPGGSVVVGVAGAGEGQQLTVDDSGPGIPAAERQRALQRFHRGQRAQAEGSGLGLSIVQRIVERHGARLSLDDSPLGGLRVAVGFPRHAATQP